LTASRWLGVFRAIAAELRSTLPPLSGSPQGREEVGTGAGGDRTVYLDALAEGIVVRHLEGAYRSGLRFRLLSEELGRRDFGGQELVLVDPLDGSLNAKLGLPYYSVVLAAAGGQRLGDVRLVLVENLVNGDEFVAEEGQGALYNGQPARPQLPTVVNGRYPVLQLDAPVVRATMERAGPLLERADRVRIMGSAALNICHAALGGISLHAAPVPVRAFDLAGPLLFMRETGGVATDFGGGSLLEVGSDLDSRVTILASASAEAHAQALQLLRGAS
jgi:myo-inositol-1(or 4)-monophosphatase